MPSGSVTKKVALFELPTDGKTQLKRKPAIKRKNRNKSTFSQVRPYSSTEILKDKFSDDDDGQNVRTCRNSIAAYECEKTRGKENNCDSSVKSESRGSVLKQDTKLSVSRSDLPVEREQTFKERVNGVSKDVVRADLNCNHNSAKSQSVYGTQKRYHNVKTVSLNTVFLFSGSFTALNAIEFDETIGNNAISYGNQWDSGSTELVSNSKFGPTITSSSHGEDVRSNADGAAEPIRRSASLGSVFKRKSTNEDDYEEPFYEELDTIYNQCPERAHTLDRISIAVDQTFSNSNGQNNMERLRLPEDGNQGTVSSHKVTSLFKGK